MREIVLDTETTGLDPGSGDRVVEIGCVELYNHISTGETFHTYINPEREMPPAAEAVHGLSVEFLSDKPIFSDIAEEFLDFVGAAPIIAHNASFDLGFINAELQNCRRALVGGDRTIDTVQIARRKFPGAQVNLDALCRRFNIDLSARVKHGALLDAELLAEVYLELIGGREPGLLLGVGSNRKTHSSDRASARRRREPRLHAASQEELEAHGKFLKQISAPLWGA